MNFITDQFYYQDALVLDRLISEYAKPDMVVFEVGSYTGRTSLTMLPYIHLMEGMLYCVDWFRGNPGAEAVINSSYQENNILDTFLNNISENGFEDYTTVLVGTSSDVAQIVAPESVDFIFIDADHRYSHIRNDILSWYPKLKPGGLICGHDLDGHLAELDYSRVIAESESDVADGYHYGVIRAVYEFFPDVKNEGTLWYAEKGDHERPILTAALQALAASNRSDPRNQTQVGGKSGGQVPGREALCDQLAMAPEHYLSLIFDDAPPVLIEEDSGYNIVRYKAKYYALAQSLGPIDITQLDETRVDELRKQKCCAVSDYLDQVKALVNQFVN